MYAVVNSIKFIKRSDSKQTYLADTCINILLHKILPMVILGRTFQVFEKLGSLKQSYFLYP